MSEWVASALRKICQRKTSALLHNSGTVHTSTKARLTSAAIGQISMNSWFKPVNHFPYLPIVTNPENNRCIQMWTRLPPKFNHLFIGPLLTPLKISCKSVRKFLRKVANRQTNNDAYISSLAEVLILSDPAKYFILVKCSKLLLPRVITGENDVWDFAVLRWHRHVKLQRQRFWRNMADHWWAVLARAGRRMRRRIIIACLHRLRRCLRTELGAAAWRLWVMEHCWWWRLRL